MRNNSGTPVANNTAVNLRFTIHDGSASGTSVFSEIQNTTTNQFGLVNVQIGSNTNMSAVNWGNGPKYLQVETDINNTGVYTDMGNSHLISVPYSFYAANNAVGSTGPTGAQGTTEPTGPNGQNGATGAQGNTGANGQNGATGAQGNSGATGPTGANGATGPIGATGAPGSSNGWSITGNNGTIDGTNFIGTKDDVALNLRINNEPAGRIETPSGHQNLAMGYQSLLSNTASYNSAYGFQAMYSNVDGGQNTGIGYQALYSNVSSWGNTFGQSGIV